MNTHRLFPALTAICLLAWALPSGGAEPARRYGIPLKPDPPPAVDGRLEEWESVPNALPVNTKEQAVFGGNQWRSAADLSAKVWLAWRQEYLYLAADVSDDRHVQKGQAQAMWQGDHLEFYLDLTPDAEPERKPFGTGQMHFGFSPGNLEQTGDPLTDIPPQSVVFTPTGATAEGVRVAAQKTDRGYALEAAVPWELLWRLARREAQLPTAGIPLNLEVGISDTDGNEPTQEKMMTILTDTWEHTRSRLLPAVLAPTDGQPPAVLAAAVAPGVDLLDAVELDVGGKREVRFAAPAVPAGKEAVLTVQARLATEKVAGYCPALRLALNGQALDGTRLTNKRDREEIADGRDLPSFGGGAFYTAYAPDFESPDKDPYYAYRHAKVCRFDLRVTDLLRAGENLLEIGNGVAPEVKRALVVGSLRLELRDPVVPRTPRPAPTGPLPVCQPQTAHRVEYALRQDADGTIEVTVGKDTFRLESQFSTPKPEWVSGPNAYFGWQREVEQRDEAILVRDTFTNLTAENLPLMQRHRLRAGKPGLRKVWLAGLSPASLTSSAGNPGNPTAYGITDTAGIGAMPVDDVFQVHITAFSAEDHIGLADNDFVLRPQATHTAEWAILPTATPDYYAFLNAARRLRDCNFAIDGGFAFLRADPRLTGKWTDQQLKDFAGYKDARFLCSGIEYPPYNGHYAHGTAFQAVDRTPQRDHLARMRALLPEAKYLIYFHCFLDVIDGGAERYADARLLRSDGQQADYGDPVYRIFVPTDGNRFGREITGNVDLILGAVPQGFGCDGVYWDELEYSAVRYHYDDFAQGNTGLPWDGVSGDIDPRTLRLTRLKSSVTLISQPFRIALAQRILKDRILIGNGQPHTRTMARLHFPRFVETGSISNCALAQMFTPIALGDHLTERNERDCYRQMLRALDYGCVYYWYDDVHVGVPTHAHLTRYMFPITPVELHEGYIIGQERILTNRSGRFGWGDASAHEVHVFDETGREVPNAQAPTVTEGGCTLTELRLAEDWSAAIVRREPAAAAR